MDLVLLIAHFRAYGVRWSNTPRRHALRFSPFNRVAYDPFLLSLMLRSPLFCNDPPPTHPRPKSLKGKLAVLISCFR